MKIVFMGTAEFAVSTLEYMANHICLVITQPDRPSGRGMKLHSSPVKIKALQLGLKVEAPASARNPEFISLIKDLKADCLLVAAYGQILNLKLLEATKYGGINLHGSILPKYRGAAPIQRAILEGQKETGVTLMQMDRGMDTGDIIAIEKTPIYSNECYLEIQDRLAKIGAEMAVKWMPKITLGQYPRIVQDANLVTYAAKITKDEAELNFYHLAYEEYNRFRAFNPRPGAYINTKFGLIKISEMGYLDNYEGKTLKLVSNQSDDQQFTSKNLQIDLQAGRVLSTSPELIIGFNKGALVFKKIQPAGKKQMSGKDFANGMHLKIGDSLLE